MGPGFWPALSALIAVAVVQDPTSWSQAAANRARMATAPTFIDGPRADLSEDDKAHGYHGVVVVRGVIDVDGAMKDTKIASGVDLPSLRASALKAAAASRFTPAKAADGTPIAIVTSMPFEFAAFKSPDGGLKHYRCGQFVKDMDWWRSAHPDKSFGDHEMYKLELGLTVMPLMRGRIDDDAVRQAVKGFDGRWAEAIETCRTRPGMLQIDAIYRRK